MPEEILMFMTVAGLLWGIVLICHLFTILVDHNYWKPFFISLSLWLVLCVGSFIWGGTAYSLASIASKREYKIQTAKNEFGDTYQYAIIEGEVYNITKEKGVIVPEGSVVVVNKLAHWSCGVYFGNRTTGKEIVRKEN